MMMTRSKSLQSKEKRSKSRMMKQDRLSALPDNILLIILSFMNTQEAFQTCILSKRWRNLWKFLPNLTLHSNDSKKQLFFFEFVSRIISGRDHNHSLHTLDFDRRIYFKPEIMTNLMSYAVSHNIQQLKINVPFNVALPACVFSCPSLTSLSISVSHDFLKRTRIPKSLELPELLSLHLHNVPISADENGHAEPFSNCKKLNTLYIRDCRLLSPEAFVGLDILYITNATLADLTMKFKYTLRYKTVISTPNLSSFTFNGYPFHSLRGQEGANVEVRSSSLIQN